ncbi:hypothetical protein B0H14DRAFT_2440804 [Mycena olivaceomarginata]|nr:hypothetical protein B0H14DRAFT_2440804 [Mycena olivaceomarginata]
MPELTQSDGLWFSNDSLVVLRAEDRIFRVPKSILAARSLVFQFMFEFPQPASNSEGEEMADGEEMFDDSPVIGLHDSGAEVQAFLRATMDTSYFVPPPSEVDFHDLLGILRLSHKYDVGYLYKCAISHIETIYPTSLDEVGQLETTTEPDDPVALELQSILVLQEVWATWLLPYAYNNIAEYPLPDLESSRVSWEDFPADKKAIIYRLGQLHMKATERLFHALTPSSNCSCSDACNLAKFDFLKCRGSPKSRTDLTPFREWQFCHRRHLEVALCATCLAQSRAQYNTVRAEIWSELPANCGLEKWDILLQQRDAALE